MAEEVLECISLRVPAEVMETFEAALSSVCRAVSFYHDEDADEWDLQGVKERGEYEDDLAAALMVAEMVSGFSPEITRGLVPVGGWLARTQQAFPEQLIGARFAIRGTHIEGPELPGRITITLDAGLAFGTGEHNSTRGCLVTLEDLVKRHHPQRILDLGTGSGILAIAAAKLMHKNVLATDIDARAARVAKENAKLNGVADRIHAIQADGWSDSQITKAAPFDLVFANILARPLCAMAHHLAAHLAPGGVAILAGLLNTQVNWVVSCHRRAGLVLEKRLVDGAWSILTLRKR
ncbi:50S ribosomal protein L11 methyltransferase [Acidocella aminolytica]|uniref:Ribosomal protein L11 methyltransferase n=1 Tax=Acidocella aminolytica 101 = DSM 11237 TaxID=1120923 RepID=A0A0D6PFX4_9PROT|nr:50S ribosomal protein L11 methyltransferase [Acidocella aminolytica]GAN79749.1 ribosomal protein L11 methyltransferase [Acidocella aminolytica 101 = DSM 11237]GBQ35613.1 50S ribosomal protein L11 methyltransferase [Acidocella aminolytica 101 = DSM 11237]SHE75376.1 [LSU ribosomal protein L11P]-lysine N-methyltransferase [Acidocella aminolytica 101 = DSM 11237]